MLRGTFYLWYKTNTSWDDYESFNSMSLNSSLYEEWLAENNLERGPEADSVFTEQSAEFYNIYSDNYDKALYFSIATGAIWVINMIDAYIVGKNRSKQIKRYFISFNINRTKLELVLNF